MEYDADVAPDPEAWLALDDQERTALISLHHDGCFPDALHSDGANEIIHASLHKIVENQIATGKPPQVAAAVARMTGEGLRRHAALHAVMQLLAEGLGQLTGENAFDGVRYAKKVDALTAGAALGTALQSARYAQTDDEGPDANPAPNRAARRAAKKQRRKNRPRPQGPKPDEG